MVSLARRIVSHENNSVARRSKTMNPGYSPMLNSNSGRKASRKDVDAIRYMAKMAFQNGRNSVEDMSCRALVEHGIVRLDLNGSIAIYLWQVCYHSYLLKKSLLSNQAQLKTSCCVFHFPLYLSPASGWDSQIFKKK